MQAGYLGRRFLLGQIRGPRLSVWKGVAKGG